MESEKEFKDTLAKKTQTINSINTYCRLRPNSSNCSSINYSITNEELTLIIHESNVNKTGMKITRSNYNNNNNSNSIRKKSNLIPKQDLIIKYSFTKIFNENTSQMEIFTEICKPMIEDLLSFNRSSLIFTYGLSNSGKTHTIIGNIDTPGILPLSLISIFEGNKENIQDKKTIECLYVEIYNEEIFDLLSPNKTKVHLKEKDKIFYFVDASVKQIESIEDFNSALNDGILRKIHSSTKMNPLSSRSHTIFKTIIKGGKNREASLSIVDLAGAERNIRTETKGKELYQAGKINQSLMVLGRCIDAMEWNTQYVHGDKKIPVPIRESKLTKIFQEYFTGEHNISMITTINPNKEDFSENKAVLSYACKAKKIQPIKSWVYLSKKAKDENKENISITMLMTGYNSDTSSEIIDNANINKQEVNANNEQYRIIKDQYSSLVNQYENSIDEAEYFKDKNSILISQIKNIEKDYLAREYNAIISKGKQFLMGTWNNISKFKSNLFTKTKTEKGQFIIANPFYRKQFEEKMCNQYETSTENIEIIQEVRKAKTFKEISDSFTIINDIKTKSKPKNTIKKAKVIKTKGYLTSTSAIDEEDTDTNNNVNLVIDNENISINNTPCVINNNQDKDESIEKDSEKKVNKIKKEKEKKTKKKKYVNDLDFNDSNSSIKSDNEKETKTKGKNNKTQKLKGKKGKKLIISSSESENDNNKSNDSSFITAKIKKSHGKTKKKKDKSFSLNESCSKNNKFSNCLDNSISSTSSMSELDNELKQRKVKSKKIKGKSKKKKVKK